MMADWMTLDELVRRTVLDELDMQVVVPQWATRVGGEGTTHYTEVRGDVAKHILYCDALAAEAMETPSPAGIRGAIDRIFGKEGQFFTPTEQARLQAARDAAKNLKEPARADAIAERLDSAKNQPSGDSGELEEELCVPFVSVEDRLASLEKTASFHGGLLGSVNAALSDLEEREAEERALPIAEQLAHIRHDLDECIDRCDRLLRKSKEIGRKANTMIKRLDALMDNPTRHIENMILGLRARGLSLDEIKARLNELGAEHD